MVARLKQTLDQGVERIGGVVSETDPMVFLGPEKAAQLPAHRRDRGLGFNGQVVATPAGGSPQLQVALQGTPQAFGRLGEGGGGIVEIDHWAVIRDRLVLSCRSWGWAAPKATLLPS